MGNGRMKMFRKLALGFALWAGISSYAIGQASDGMSPSSLPGSVDYTYYYNGASWDRARTPVIYKTFSGTVVTTAQTLWTPASGKSFRLMGFCITMSVAVGDVTLADGATNFFVVPRNTLNASQCSGNMVNGYLSIAANNALTAIGASTEAISGTIWGTEE